MSGFFGGEFGDNVEPISRADLLMAPPITRGKYRDWQGDLYDVMHVVRDVHEGLWLVLYRSLVDVEQPMMVMSYARFFGTVDVGAYRPVPRFSPVEEVAYQPTSPIPPPLPRASFNGRRTEGGTKPNTGTDASGHGQAVGGSGGALGATLGAAVRASNMAPRLDVAPVASELPTRRLAPRAPKTPAFQRAQEAIASKVAASDPPATT